MYQNQYQNLCRFLNKYEVFVYKIYKHTRIPTFSERKYQILIYCSQISYQRLIQMIRLNTCIVILSCTRFLQIPVYKILVQESYKQTGENNMADYLQKYRTREAKECVVVDQDGCVLSVCSYLQAQKWARAKNAIVYLNQGITAPHVVKDYRLTSETRAARQLLKDKRAQKKKAPQVKTAIPVEEVEPEVWTDEDTARSQELLAKLKEDGDLPMHEDQELIELKKKYERLVE